LENCIGLISVYYNINVINLEQEKARIRKRIGEASFLGRSGYRDIKREPDAAIEKLTKAIEATFDPNIGDYIDELSPVGSTSRLCFDLDRTEFYTWRAEAYLEKGDYDSAIADFTKVIEHFDPPIYHFHVSSCYQNRAEAYLSKGCYDWVIEECAKLNLIEPKNFLNSEQMDIICARAYFEKGNCKAAVENCDKALKKLSQKEWDCLWNMAQEQYFHEEGLPKYLEIEMEEIANLKSDIGSILAKCGKKSLDNDSFLKGLCSLNKGIFEKTYI